jgi:hypothetical protein
MLGNSGSSGDRTHYTPEHQSLLIDWPLGTIIATGPKAGDSMINSAIIGPRFLKLMEKIFWGDDGG